VDPPSVESSDLSQLAGPTLWPLRPMYEYLVGTDPVTGKLVPQLATEWKLGLEGGEAVARYKLRKGVQFHKGWGEVTAADVVHTWRDLTRAGTPKTNADYYREVTKDIEVINDYEVVFHLLRADANFVSAHGEQDGSVEIQSKKHFDALGRPTLQTGPIAGTAPYQFKERTQGAYLRFERVPYKHWRTTPDISEFEFRWMKEPSTRLAALLTGEVHVTSLTEDLLQQAERQDMKVVRSQVPGSRVSMQIWCCNLVDGSDPAKGVVEGPLNDARVCKALSKAIDRNELNKAFLGSKGQIMHIPHFHPSRMGWNPQWERQFPEEYGYDAAAAKALLSEGGYNTGNPLTVSLIGVAAGALSGGELDMIDAIAGYWRAIGVNLNLLQADQTEIMRLSRANKLTNHLQMRSTSATLYASVWIFHSFGFGTGDRSYLYNPEINKLFGQLRNTIDEAKQEELYRQIGDVSYKAHLEVPLFWLPAQAVVNPRFISDYVFPGSITGTWTHVQNIKQAS